MSARKGAQDAHKQTGQTREKSEKADLISLAAHRPLATSGTRNTIIASTGNPSKPSQISFDRKELNAILRIYGFRVADGEWRDYAIDHLKDRAVFSIYRRASEAPLFRVEKNPKLANRQGAYSVSNQNGTILKRGHDLTQVLKVFERKIALVQ
ncbi:MAG: DUF2794 domain-containing protein [Pseudomonadota bacterium]